MPVYKDEERNTWYVKCYYEDCYGKIRQKKKRGFKLRKEAKAWEDNFLSNDAKVPTITFNEVLERYYDDVQYKVVPSTLSQKKMTIGRHIVPIFGDLPIMKISPEMILSWQNDLRSTPQVVAKDKVLSARSIHGITAQLAAVLNFAVRYYNLPQNPVNKLDKVKYEKKQLDFWDVDQFKKAVEFSKGIEMHLIFQMLFYGGFRIGELQALTPADLRERDMSVSVTKTYKYIDGEWVKGPPKSPNSTRRVALPEFVWKELKGYISKLYHHDDNSDIFTCSRSKIRTHLDNAAKFAKVPRIRVHDLRHSHVSYLISLGFTTYEIADRIGDTPFVVEKIYAHMYESKRMEIAKKLQSEHQNEAS